MPGKRDTADAIRAFLRRNGLDADRARKVRDLRFENGSLVKIDGEEVDADIADISVSVSTDFDTKLERAAEAAAKVGPPKSLEDMVDEVRGIRERRSFRRLRDEAATTLTVDDPVTVDDFRDLVERLRREGYGGAPSYDPGSWVDVTYDTSGTVFVCGVGVDDDLRDDRYSDRFGGGLSIDGVPVLKSKKAPTDEAVLVDTDALVPIRPPFGPPDPKDPRFEVRDPRGVAALRVEGGR